MGEVRIDPFDGLVERFARDLGGRRGAERLPRADVEETGDAYLIEVELPGVPADDVTVELTGSRLAVRGRPRARPRAGAVHVATRSDAPYRLELTLPKPVEGDAVRASYDDGVLTLLVPKQAPARARRIAVVVPGS